MSKYSTCQNSFQCFNCGTSVKAKYNHSDTLENAYKWLYSLYYRTYWVHKRYVTKGFAEIETIRNRFIEQKLKQHLDFPTYGFNKAIESIITIYA